MNLLYTSSVAAARFSCPLGCLLPSCMVSDRHSVLLTNSGARGAIATDTRGPGGCHCLFGYPSTCLQLLNTVAENTVPSLNECCCSQLHCKTVYNNTKTVRQYIIRQVTQYMIIYVKAVRQYIIIFVKAVYTVGSGELV